MAQFMSRSQLLRATDEEINKFFEETIFEGVFSKEIKSQKEEYYKGHISSIRLEGRPTKLVGIFLNVPKTSKSIPEGPCSFKCRIKDISAFREDSAKYIPTLVGASLRSIKELTTPVVSVSAKDAREEDLFEFWGVDSCECIAFYDYNEERQEAVFSDIRKPNFDHIPYYPGDKDECPIQISFPNKIRGIKPGNYYLFTWKLSHKNEQNPYEIFIDFQNPPKDIDPKWFIDKLFEDRYNDKSKNFGSATNFLDTLSKQLSAKNSTFVYELLQNANDYPVEGKKVDVEFHITENYLLFMHSGEEFNVRNISGICGINEKEKVANKRAIGYKGIGFKTVFLHNHYVYLQTGAYSFRFDEKAKKIKRLGAPYQILPVWTERHEVAQEVKSVFDASDKKFRVRIALRPEEKKMLHEGKGNYETIFKKTFADANIILFIPNIRSVKVVIDGKEERMCLRNPEEWVVNDYEEEIPVDLQTSINKTIEKGNSRIPEKYENFDCTRVSFACKHEGDIIKPIGKATIYCYLPTKASWGFPFLMNTDMIPKGDRNDIETEVNLIGEEELNFNEELAAIAGAKFFSWIKDLLTSRKYALGSVFSLIPDFDECKELHELYENFIEKFEDAFNECIEEEQIVPVSQGIANVNYVIRDTTGLSASGIMSDEEFCRFAGFEEDAYLPLHILRENKHFNTFLQRYANEELEFAKDHLEILIRNEDFQEWLKDQDNNNKFLDFLAKKGYLKDLLNEAIFLEDAGDLYAAGDLYYDVDKYLDDLEAFTDQIYFLSSQTREFFKGDRKWKNTIDGAFAEFDCNNFVKDILLSSDNENETKEKLRDKETSIRFFKFLAKNVEFDEDFLSLPFIDDNDEAVDDFDGRFLFFSSKEGHDICDSTWLSNLCIHFISDGYDAATEAYFKEHFDVKSYSDKTIIEDILLSEKDYVSEISDAIGKDLDASKEFVNFCFANSKWIPDNALAAYSLLAFDVNGDKQWYTAEDNVFFSSSHYDYYAAKEWIGENYMASLDEAYFEDVADRKVFKTFLQCAFGVKELSDKEFYCRVIRENLNDIFKNTSGSNDSDGSKNIDFVKYLDDNYLLIFEKEKDTDKFGNLQIVTHDIKDISADNKGLYLYSRDLKDITDYEWFPEDVLTIAHPDYGDSRTLKALGVKSYKFSNFFDEVIVENIGGINETISSKEDSISFHRFVVEHLNSLTPDQQTKMKAAKVYLYGQDEPVQHSDGHKTLSANAKELFDLGLVEFSDLDIIDPDYKTEENTDYWVDRLKNSKFTINHFSSWVKENLKTFSDTLKNEELNIAFWRWLKANAADTFIKEVSNFPILLKNDEISKKRPVYFSDEYMGGAGIEQAVRLFDEDALFLSPNYMGGEDNVEDWKLFFCKVGIKHEVVDILVETVIPQLSSIEDESLPKLLAENREVLEKRYEVGLVSQLASLRVKARNGQFYSVAETIYIDCEKEEPFSYIELPNQIAFDSVEERRLVKEIIKSVNGDCVETLSEWQQRKLTCYLTMQDRNAESVRAFHYQFINDLAEVRSPGKDSLKDLEGIEKIQLLNREDQLCTASTLTMGSVYKPFFDFEACGVDLTYVSDAYAEECSEYLGKIFRELKVHCDFLEKDIEHLTARQCALYFWGAYLLEKDANISLVKKLISEEKFNEIACIPTKEYMKCASELYYGTEVSKYVKSIEDWENKIPLESLSDIRISDGTTLFSLLPFKTSLNFLDALYAIVTITGQDRRTQLLSWMIEGYNETYDAKIDEYREDEQALWYNNKNEKIQIKDLYALDFKDKTLEQVFGMNPRVVNKAYFPSGDSFKRACDIFKIKTITSEDLSIEPAGDSVFTAYNTHHKLYALVIAGMTDVDKWLELYDDYTQKLAELVFHKCESILITYTEDDSISRSLKKFYRKGSHFYFVGDLNDKRVFKSFVDEYIEFLGIKTADIDRDLIEEIMNSREDALEIAKEQNTLMLDEDFKNKLSELCPNCRDTLRGTEAVEDAEGQSIHRPSFTTKESAMDIEDAHVTEDMQSQSAVTTASPEAEAIDATNASIPLEADEPIEVEAGFGEVDTAEEDVVTAELSDCEMGEEIAPMKNENISLDTRTPDIESLRSHGTPLELESLGATTEEVDLLKKYSISPEQIADTYYLVQLRLYQTLKQRGYELEETEEEFVRNAEAVAKHKLKNGKYIHACSAASGVMYISPSVWNKVRNNQCEICVYLDGRGKSFHFITSEEELLQLVEKDDVVLKITGKEKVQVIQKLYNNLLRESKGTAYTLIRVAGRTAIDAVFAPYIGAMAETDDTEDLSDY